LSEKIVHFIVRLETREMIAQFFGHEPEIPAVGAAITVRGREYLGSLTVQDVTVDPLETGFLVSTLIVKSV
jgi:hypothetical protein